jgi:hypothetical protein
LAGELASKVGFWVAFFLVIGVSSANRRAFSRLARFASGLNRQVFGRVVGLQARAWYFLADLLCQRGNLSGLLVYRQNILASKRQNRVGLGQVACPTRLPNDGRRGSHPPRRHDRTGHETFASSGSSDNRLLSRVLRSMDFIMAVTMQ